MQNNNINLGDLAKVELMRFVKIIDNKLNEYWSKEVGMGFGYGHRQRLLVNEILKHASEHNLRPAKRIRGAFVVNAFGLSGKVDDRIWKVAMGVELVHTALLMHDDFMDEDKLRRGKPTTHEFFAKGDKHKGESMAVNVGDAVLCLGYEMILQSGFESEILVKSVAYLMRTIANTAFGQAYDVELSTNYKWSEQEVIDLHKAKTALYTYENPLVLGALLGGLGEEVVQILKEYAHVGGVAFQLQDDILGLFGESESTGKSVDSDLLQGKCTLLVLKALELGNEKQREAIEKVWGKKEATEEGLLEAKTAIKNSGSYNYSKSLARKMATEAALCASKLRNLNLAPEAIGFIQGVAEYMVEREV